MSFTPELPAIDVDNRDLRGAPSPPIGVSVARRYIFHAVTDEDELIEAEVQFI
jgi:hypothetical protein